ncbi:MAG: DUF6448 family protein [Phycisphaerae bacterium]|nr:DUF6448 family protein [Phycisphaerae bacterium]
MRMLKQRGGIAVVMLGLSAIVLAWPSQTMAHCDTMDGPVVTDARQALEKGDPTPVLKWVKKEHETEIREAFKKTLAVRTKGPEARELADMYFFETLVRIHRAGEGAPYTGLKPAGTELDPSVVASDRALESGSVDALVKMITDLVAGGIRQRFTRAAAAKEHAGHTVDAGREFVAAYVEFVHYVERLYLDAKGAADHNHGAAATVEKPEHAEHAGHDK